MLRKRQFLRAFTLAAGGLFVPRIMAADRLRQMRMAYPQAKPRVVAGGITYLLSEDCEGGGTPAGWVDAGAVDWDYAPGLVDAQSLYISTNTINTTSPSFAAASIFDFFFAFSISAVPLANSTIVAVRNAASVGILSMTVRATGTVRMLHGAVSTGDIFTPNLNTTYFIWMHYEVGGGANGIAYLYYSLNQTKPGAPDGTILNGDAITDGVKVRFTAPATDPTIYDKIRVSTSIIGSNPT